MREGQSTPASSAAYTASARECRRAAWPSADRPSLSRPMCGADLDRHSFMELLSYLWKLGPSHSTHSKEGEGKRLHFGEKGTL
jgi:hypothetical protein